MTIYVCGDSTAASYPPRRAPITGWGQLLSEKLGGAPVVNAARGGRSTKSFLAEGRLLDVEKCLAPGDLLLIQFTHNDPSDLVWRHTDPWTSFMSNLAIFVDTARQYGAIPVLLTPIPRRYFLEGALQPSHGDYLDAIRTLARQKGVALIDIYQTAWAHLSALGDEASRALYMNLAPGLYPAYPHGQADDTHTQKAGADYYASLTADGLRALELL